MCSVNLICPRPGTLIELPRFQANAAHSGGGFPCAAMKLIQVTQSKFTMVDDCRFDELSKYKWHLSHGYVVRNGPKIKGKRSKKIRMHVVISGSVGNEVTDHRDMNPLNNLDNNLRVCSMKQNQCNRGKQKNNTTGFKGVDWVKGKGKFRASIGVDGKVVHLGYFHSVEEASLRYKNAADLYHGEFARI